MSNVEERVEDLLLEVAALPPDAAVDRLRARGELGSQFAHLAADAERLVISDLGRAMWATERLVSLADAAGDPMARVRARRARAQALAYSNRFVEALAMLNEAAMIGHAAGERGDAARAQLTSIHALARLGRFEEALAAGEAARRIFIELGERAYAGKADANLGVTRRMMDDPRGALAHFERARRALGDDPLAVAQVESNRAEALLDLNEFSAAEEAFAAALAAFEQAGVARAAAIVEGNLADLMARQGRFHQALAYFERARRRLGQTDAPGDVARLEAERAETLAAAGLHQEAADCLCEVLGSLRRHGMAWEAARARAALGRALLRLGRQAEAEQTLAAAADEFAALGHASGAARVNLLRADILARERRFQEAADLAARSLGVLGDRPADLAAAQLQVAVISAMRGDIPRAELEAAAALRGAEELDVPPLRADALQLVGRLRRAAGDRERAAADLHRAIEQVERIRGTLLASRVRAAFLGDRASLYEECFSADLDLEPDRPSAIADAFAVAERAKSRVLLDLLHSGADLAAPAGERSGRAPVPDRSPDAASAEQELLAELEAARAELNALYARLDCALVSREPLRDPVQWRERLRWCEGRIDSLQTRLTVGDGGAGGGRYAGAFGVPIGLDAARAMLNPTTAMIQYFAEEGWISAIVVRDAGAAAVRRMAPIESVSIAAERLGLQIGRALARASTPRARAADPAGALRELRKLHAFLLAPLRTKLRGADRLVVLPYGLLHGIPFHALHDGERHVIERWEVVQAPSASILAHLRERARAGPAAGRAVVVGLGEAAHEARHVADAIGRARTVLLLDEDATRSHVLAAASGAGLLHVASHAKFVPAAPMASGIRLADGWLTVRDIVATDLSGASVTLSACETGCTAVGAGDEAAGLARGFLEAGASSVVMSLWSVQDESTTQMMACAYQQLYAGARGGHGGLGGSLRRAQRELMSRRPHPATWAPFVTMGAP